MQFKNKKELIEFINNQTGVLLENDKNNILNNKRKLLHTTINKINKNKILTILNKYSIKYENHIGENYFIFVK